MRLQLRTKTMQIEALEKDLLEEKAENDPLRAKLDNAIRYSMTLKVQIANLEERLKSFDKHATIARYKDRAIDKELEFAEYEI